MVVAMGGFGDEELWSRRNISKRYWGRLSSIWITCMRQKTNITKWSSRVREASFAIILRWHGSKAISAGLIKAGGMGLDGHCRVFA